MLEGVHSVLRPQRGATSSSPPPSRQPAKFPGEGKVPLRRTSGLETGFWVIPGGKEFHKLPNPG